ncbi:hypothetical protein NUU61_005892 [Penicillium alfredii]|uniref:Uncharacterized protein n=1 Tax=Penicillium alfredii TaxID=1506179 RepID=A0A9W9FAJ0_9EURO|nr:uncharacterized protein NUU61_005892 [Penicillium alfredii]KAJ5096536.1 hypothetical protein NUU61_005892 [Penicillium alfredii]
MVFRSVSQDSPVTSAGGQVACSQYVRSFLGGSPDAPAAEVVGSRARPGRCFASGSGGPPRPPAPLESVDRWPLATIDTQIPGGAAPREPPFVGVVRGVRSPHPRAVCRSLPASARAPGFRNTCVRTGTEGLCGGKWMVSLCPPRYAGGAAGAGRRRAPLPPSNYWPSPPRGVVVGIGFPSPGAFLPW